jgi:hypothetical protein
MKWTSENEVQIDTVVVGLHKAQPGARSMYKLQDGANNTDAVLAISTNNTGGKRHAYYDDTASGGIQDRATAWIHYFWTLIITKQ